MKEAANRFSPPMLVHRTASLVLAVGDFAGDLLANFQSLFHNGDPGRWGMVGFYKVVSAQDDGVQVSVGRISKPPETRYGTAEVGTVQAQASSSLEAVLHDLRLHENYLAAGLSDEQDMPLGLIVLVDLTEAGSELLYPLLIALREKMTKEPGSYMYVLCKTAIFETDAARKLMQASLHIHFGELRKLAQEAGIKFQTYLFDGLKDGFLEAKDSHEIAVLMQNFLLALLSGRFGQSLARTYALADGSDQAEFFHSAGATALIYDPAALQDYCARQFAVETLEIEFLPDRITDPAQIDAVVNGILESMGDVSVWAADLCAATPFHPALAEMKSAAGRAAAACIKLDLHFSDLTFEDLPPQEWGDAIVGYGEHFTKELQALHFETLQKNASALAQAVSTSSRAELKSLPAYSNLYPGGIANAIQVVEACTQVFTQRAQACLPVQNEEEHLTRLEREYASAMEKLDQAIDDLPDLPRWVKRLPAKLYTYAKLLFEYLFLQREYAQLLVLREKIIQALEAKFIFQFEQRLRASIAELCSQMMSSLEETRAALSALHAKFQRLTDHFREQTPDPIPGSSTLPLPSVVRLSPFRIHLVTPALFQWAHLHRTMGSAEVRRELLEGDLLLDWRNASEESLRDELMSACRRAYQFLYKFSAEDVLKETHLPDLSGMTQGTVPALRPDFDLSGENTSYSANYFLCADPRRSEIPDALKASFGEQRTWQEIETSDPSVIVFCRVCQMIPVGALSALLGSSQAAFESLEQQEQTELQRAFQRQRS